MVGFRNVAIDEYASFNLDILPPSSPDTSTTSTDSHQPSSKLARRTKCQQVGCEVPPKQRRLRMRGPYQVVRSVKEGRGAQEAVECLEKVDPLRTSP